MRHLGRVLWLVPLSVHIGYISATYWHLPQYFGSDSGESTNRTILMIEWFAIIGMANLIFSFIHVRLPRFSDRMLAVPGKAYWLATEERRIELVERLKGVCESALFNLNIFFLAVYQSIYQSNVMRPTMFIPPSVLVLFFMAVPLLVLVAAVLAASRTLASRARRA